MSASTHTHACLLPAGIRAHTCNCTQSRARTHTHSHTLTHTLSQTHTDTQRSTHAHSHTAHSHTTRAHARARSAIDRHMLSCTREHAYESITWTQVTQGHMNHNYVCSGAQVTKCNLTTYNGYLQSSIIAITSFHLCLLVCSFAQCDQNICFSRRFFHLYMAVLICVALLLFVALFGSVFLCLMAL